MPSSGCRMKKEIERLEAAGQCCVYVITEQNRDKAAPKTRWCLELDSGQDDLDAQWLYRVWQRHEGIAGNCTDKTSDTAGNDGGRSERII